VGACSGFVGAGYIGGQWFGMAKFSFMFGLVQLASSFFSAFNQNLLSLALTSIPWRELFNFIGLFGIGLFIPIHPKSNADGRSITASPEPQLKSGRGSVFAQGGGQASPPRTIGEIHRLLSER
jgi:hypothetical protein